MSWDPENDFRQGDLAYDLLRKILTRLGNLPIQTVMGLQTPSSVASVSQVTLTDRSGTTTTANVSQQVAAANSTRTYFLFVNNSGSPMWINFGTAATLSQPSILVAQNGGSFVMEGPTISSEAIFVICNASGKSFTAKEG